MVIEVVAGTAIEGYVAIDEVHFDNLGDCNTVPDFAAPGTTSQRPQTTTATSAFSCDFNEGPCDWKNAEDGWKWAW